MNSDFSFLLVEDNDVDYEVIERSLKKLKIANPLFRAQDGIEALEFLEGSHPSGIQIKAPYLILLDLNMPRMSGVEFLRELRQRPHLKSAIVIVLTTSDREEDISEAYDYHVAGYLVKPPNVSEILDMFYKLEAFWKLSLYPSNEGSMG